MKTLPVALQVYSIREEAQDDFENAMQEIKNMGYEGVELAGLYDHSPEEIRDCLKRTGLTPISAHVSYQEFMEDLQGTIDCYVTIGCRYLAIPYLAEEDRYGTKNFDSIIKNIPIIANACKKSGITLLYHNHDFEFVKTEQEEYVLDYIYRVIPKEELEVELDTCWVKVVGIDPAQYLRKYSGRSPVVHAKDFNDTETFEFRAVGHGVQNIPSILEAAVEVGCEWIIVEQDGHTEHSAMEDARLSREYLKTLGW